jgi:hypothetical protein
MNSNGNTLIGFAVCLLGGSLLCFPVLGVSGLISAFCAIYFGLVLVNSADGAANRKNRKQNRRR